MWQVRKLIAPLYSHFSPGDSLKEEKKFSLIVLGGKFEEATYLAKFGTPAHVYNNRFD